MLRPIAALLLGILAAGMVQAVQIQHGYVRGMPPGQANTAAFMVMVNDTAAAVVLTGASSPVAARVEIHQHMHVAGMMQMRQVDQLTIPAGGSQQFAPGGYHLMLLDLQQPLQESQLVQIQLDFQDDSAQEITLPVYSVLNEKQRLQEAAANGN